MMTMLKVLDLFSGIGGFSFGLERTGGFETVAFCEYEAFPRAVLAKHWPDVPCFPDVRTLKGSDIDGTVDVICGGYPCQPFSTAGQRRGKEDDRHLWPEFSRLVAELRPAWVIGENVAGHISMGLDDVLSDLEGQGYACRTFVIPACAVGAPHRRDRVWTVANANVSGHNRTKKRKLYRQAGKQGLADDACNEGRSARTLADAKRLGQPQQGQPIITSDCAPESEGQANHAFAVSQPGKWRAEPNVGRVANGVSRRVDRLKALGNAVVPQIPEMIGRAILAAEKETA
jgi:DNA (cytosine-5)-methyltransferase 1